MNASRLNCTTRSSGTHTVTVTVTDARGGVTTASTSFTIAAAAGLFGLSPVAAYAPIGGIVIVVLAAVVVVARRRRNGAKGSSPPDDVLRETPTGALPHEPPPPSE
ncbi:MAG: hypothetical protein ACREDK_00155 [Thermoplasmata archaeon]